ADGTSRAAPPGRPGSTGAGRAASSTKAAAAAFTASPASARGASPSRVRQETYSSRRLAPKNVGSSEFTVTRTPAATSRGSGCRAYLRTTPLRTFEVGQTSTP